MSLVKSLVIGMMSMTLSSAAFAQVYGSPVFRGNPPVQVTPGHGGPGFGHDGDHDRDDHHGGWGHHGFPGGPGGYPPYPTYPTYPSYPPYPTYPTYPPINPGYPSFPPGAGPGNVIGPCTIDAQYAGQNTRYTVMNSYGATVLITYDYNQAYQAAANAQMNRQCSSIMNTGNGAINPYPQPNPYPYPQQQTYCQVMPGGNAYGQDFYRVLDRAGRIIVNSCSYADAQRTAQTDPRCFQMN